jgi:molecular chaperone DnaK (HSP70)
MHGLPKSLLSKLCSPAMFATIRDFKIEEILEVAYQWVEEESDLDKLDNLESLFSENQEYIFIKEIEKTKINLCHNDSSFFDYKERGININKDISAKSFLEKSEGVSNKIEDCMLETLKKAELKPSDISIILCSGGTLKNQTLKDRLLHHFKDSEVINISDHKAVVEGLSIIAHELLK